VSVLVCVCGLLVLLVLATLKSLVISELTGRVPALCEALIELAVKRLPEPSRERYREEWQADLLQMRSTPLSAIKHALLVGIGAGSMRAQLAARDRARSIRDARRAGLLILEEVQFARTRTRRSHAGPLVEWQEVIGAIRRDGAPESVEEPLEQANVRFAALLAPAQPSSVRALQTLRDRGAAASIGVGAAAPAAPRVEISPQNDPYWHRPLRTAPIVRRFGPGGAVDPEWSIAPLTRRERRVAETYRRSALENVEETDLCGHWPSGVRDALLSAVEHYDDSPWLGRDYQPGDGHVVRLSVFLGAWATPEQDLGA
jgi:hypothetical protein